MEDAKQIKAEGQVDSKSENSPRGLPDKPEMIQISKEEWDKVQERLKLLYDVADKGRVFSYESARTEKKPIRIKLSKFAEGIIVGWRTLKDQAVFHPTTGKQVGEEQEYEILIDKEGKIEKAIINGYPNFSEARYKNRIECEVRGKSEDYEGKVTYDVSLPDGRVIKLASQFIN